MLNKFFRIGMSVLLAAAVLPAQYENSPSSKKIIPEVIWAGAEGGGSWQTELKIMSKKSDTVVTAYFYPGASIYRQSYLAGPLEKWELFTTDNVLQLMQTQDAGWDYFNQVGCLVLETQDIDHRIQVNVRTWHSDGYSKSFNAFNETEGQYINHSLQHGSILNLSSDEETRSSIACFNAYVPPVEAEFYVVSPAGEVIASFRKSLGTFDFRAFDPFAEAGLSGRYTDHYLYVVHVSGDGRLFVLGASANNATNDPAAHLLLPYDY